MRIDCVVDARLRTDWKPNETDNSPSHTDEADCKAVLNQQLETGRGSLRWMGVHRPRDRIDTSLPGAATRVGRRHGMLAASGSGHGGLALPPVRRVTLQHDFGEAGGALGRDQEACSSRVARHFFDVHLRHENERWRRNIAESGRLGGCSRRERNSGAPRRTANHIPCAVKCCGPTQNGPLERDGYGRCVPLDHHREGTWPTANTITKSTLRRKTSPRRTGI